MKHFPLKLIVFIFCLTINAILFSQNRELNLEKKTDFPGGKIESATAFSLGKKGYVCMGTQEDNLLKACWQYDPVTSEWKKMSDFSGEARKWMVAFAINERAYIATGLNNSMAGMKDIWEYNPSADSWTQKAALPGDARSRAIGFSIGDKGYIGLGVKDGGLKYCNDLWEYNPKNNQWTKKSDFPEKGRIDASVFVIENSAFVLFGGQFLKMTAPNSDIYEYDVTKNKWEQKSSFPGPPRMGAIAFTLLGKGYIYAGYNGNNIRYEDFWEYDPVSNSWNLVSGATAGVRNNAFCFVIDSNAYVGCGMKQTKLLGGGSSNDFWCIKSLPVKINVDYSAKLLYQDSNRKLPLSKQGVSLMSEEKKIIQTTQTNDDGSFVFNQIDKEGKYQVILDKNDKLPANASVAIAKPSGKIMQELEKNANGQFTYEISTLDFLEEDDSYFNLQYFVKSSDKEITITANIVYPPASWELSVEASNVLYQVIVSLNQYPQLIVEISSHTDSRGSNEENMLLSENRAKKVVDYVISNNIDTKRITGKGFGETKIINKCKNGVNCSEDEHKINRRTEFKFIKQ